MQVVLQITRKTCYAIILVYYYSFAIVYSWVLDYKDAIVAIAVITIVTYLWLIRGTSLEYFRKLDYKNLVTIIAVYSFVSFYFAGMAMILSNRPVDFFHAFLIFTPVTVWIFIWTDYYIQRIDRSERKETHEELFETLLGKQ